MAAMSAAVPLHRSRLGRYRLLAPLGAGGMAEVWSARDEIQGHVVALKLLSPELARQPEARRRFRHEAQIAAWLDHPGIITVHDSGEHDGQAWMAMALIEGETLARRLARSLIPVAEAVRIAAEVAEALAYAHSRGVIHRDVTSRNIMLAADGRAIVLDFGLALAAGLSRVSSSSSRVGTAVYMAPEILLGHEAGPASDLYGLGMTLYESLTGTLAFDADRFEALQYAALNQPVRPPSELRAGIGDHLDRVVLRALDRDPARRQASAAELAAELRRPDPAAPLSGEAGARSGSPAPRRAPIYLAVVPLPAPGPDGADDQGRLSADLSAALGAALPRESAIHVVPLPEVPNATGVRDLAQRAGANRICEVTLRVVGQQARVRFRLIEVDTGHAVGGGQVAGAVADPFALEEQLIAAVRTALGAAAGMAARPPDPAADDRFAQALRNLARDDHEPAVDAAIAQLARLLESGETRPGIHAALARGYLARFRITGQHAWQAKAAAEVERALAHEPESAATLCALADVHAAAGRSAAARGEYQRAIERDPSLIEARVGLARVLETLGEPDAAERCCREAIAAAPGDWRAHHQLALLHFHRGDYAQALEPWQEVLRLTPDNTRAASNLGSAYFHLDRFDDAVAAYRRSLAIQPSAVAYSSLGTVLYYLERFDEAADAFERAVRLRDSDPLVWGNLGNAGWFIPGRRDRAREALARAIGLMRDRLARNPDDAEGWSRLAGWLANLGEGEALPALERALALAPADVHIMVDAVQIHAQLGNRAGALEWLRTALDHGYGAESFARSPLLSPLREDPEFQRILASHPRHPGARPKPLR